ncbi:cytochrome c biogenesis protein ResB [Noviherbaspirillum autotrophicum]|uniref:Cytochrome C biogenesis protein ResB n=1 Tax=Noviherbaspirillum autotrophicum TaxID=709839 RepID=A0A0C2BJV8_9BURK|nr:cytochrome c biogenesis protein ResB [Noviherbaspirillum autotrophicum]KIF80299.1 cytochrome C biogenesis protein ResB [Noviherbaspirillum autotrophicum]
MSVSTSGLQLKTERRWLADTVELISSMRFAISLLTLIAVASVIGTVLKQNEPMPNYVNQFGPFWFEVFGKLGLYAVYSAWWFLLIMAFLVVSTSLCIARNTPKMLKDMRSWRENVREHSLRNFHHKLEWTSSAPLATLTKQLAERVAGDGYQVKVVDKKEAVLIAAKRGAANKWGYIFAHSAIVIICIGGLLDSDLPIRFQEWFGNKTPFAGGGIISDIPQQHRLSPNNPTFRGNTFIPEGATSSTAIIARQNGALVQDLPFSIELKKFIIEHYSTGMPKLFASEVVVHDRETGKSFPATIKVNEPLIYKGVAVYQSSFDDGGSKLKLLGYPMSGAQRETISLAGEVGGTTSLGNRTGEDYTIEWSGFRPFNVENMAQSGQDVRAVDANKSFNEKFAAGLDKQLGSGAKNASSKDLKNVGPSVQYKLRDKTGQAREYHNYMQPMLLDGAYVFLTGMRDSPNEPFRYLRIPADDNDSVDEWMRLRAALFNPQLREQAAARYALHALPDSKGDTERLRTQLQKSSVRGLEIFAGEGKEGGYIAVSRFLEKLPAAEQEKAAEVFMRILNGSMWELWQVAREKDGLQPNAADDKHGRFLQLATNAISDAFFYGAPVYLQLKEFQEVKASVLQVTRSPGKKVVYLGCLLLTLGVFAMFYIRERRLWIWLKSDTDGKSHALMAMSTQRKTLDFEKEFEVLKARLAQSG